MKTFRPYSPRQSFLLPPSPLEWLPEDHLAYFILDVVSQLDLTAILAPYEQEERGYPPHHPQMMLGLLLYGYCVGVASSRKIERKTHEDVAFRVVSGGAHPDHSCIADFRTRHRQAFADLFKQVLQLCMKAKLVKLGHVALDWRGCCARPRPPTPTRTSDTARIGAATSCPRTCATPRRGWRGSAPRRRSWRPRPRSRPSGTTRTSRAAAAA